MTAAATAGPGACYTRRNPLLFAAAAGMTSRAPGRRAEGTTMGSQARRDDSRRQVTDLLADYAAGDLSALDGLVPRLYDELRRIARRHMRGERRGHTLATTALVHEAYVALADPSSPAAPRNRAHFLAIASRLMRNILVDHARRRGARKRGGGLVRTTLDDALAVADGRAVGLLDLDRALERLSGYDERLAQVVEYRFFAGMTLDETAEVLGLSSMTVSRDWQKARAWLRQFLCDAAPEATADA